MSSSEFPVEKFNEWVSKLLPKVDFEDRNQYYQVLKTYAEYWYYLGSIPANKNTVGLLAGLREAVEKAANEKT